MTDRITKLHDVAAGQAVPAEIHTALALSDLLDAESDWTPWRFGLIKQLDSAGVPQTQWPEHWYWNWVHKLLASKRIDIGNALSPFRLMGMMCTQKWQGLVLVTSIGYQTRLKEGGKDLVYVKYLETAPWNIQVDVLGQTPSYRGVGRQLIELAARLSEAMEFRGRIGLHALPQAEGFYKKCGMTDLGADSDSNGLRYFEMSEEQAATFLNLGRTS